MKTTQFWTPAPFGAVAYELDSEGRLVSLRMEREIPAHFNSEGRVAVQLQEYFRGERTVFELELAPHGTEFQKKVWGELQKIPYGKVESYLDLANRIGNPNACRAVGGANGKNPIAIVIPCHRVIGANGKLTGFTYGLEAKQFLLDLEAKILARS